MTWEEVAKILTIYELELQEGTISRYGDASSLEKTSRLILEKYDKFNSK